MLMSRLNQLVGLSMPPHLVFVHYREIYRFVLIFGIKHLFQVILQLMFTHKMDQQQQRLLHGVDLEQLHEINGHMLQLMLELIVVQCVSLFQVN
jgi:hypothetical protein